MSLAFCPRTPHFDSMGQENLPELKHIEREELEVYNLQNPRAVLNLVPEEMRKKVLECKEKYPDYFNKPDNELKTLLRADNKGINQTDDTLRIRFWTEYERAQTFGLKAMNIANVTYGICTGPFFHQFYLRAPSRVAWLMCPPLNLTVKQEAILANIYDDFNEIAMTPAKDQYGNVDYKLMELKLKIFKEVDARRNGVIVQKHEHKVNQKNLNLNLDLPAKDTKDVMAQIQGDSMEDIEKRYKELRLKEQMLDGVAVELPAKPIDE